MVICMSPVGDSFRSRCRMFPSLVNCCTIDWFTVWPREALLSVAQSFFEHIDLGDEATKVYLHLIETLTEYLSWLSFFRILSVTCALTFILV